MKKNSFILVGLFVILMSALSGVALTFSEKEQWSNYVHTWGVKKTNHAQKKVKVKNKETEIPICVSKR